MTLLHLEAPTACDVELDELIGSLTSAPRLRPFEPPVVAFCARLSDALWSTPAARPYPAIRALAFWLRASNVAAMERSFPASQGIERVPRGLTFHLPPSNVDTLFVYSWVLALLAGNASVVRLPTAPSDGQHALLGVVREALRDDATIAAQVAMIRYPHDDAITAALSGAADVRIVWGGDVTVGAIRRIPIGPLAVDLAFPDRTSLASIGAAAYLALDDAGRQRLAEAFESDAYSFDGLACSSPRLVLWCGNDAEARPASDDFWPRVARVNEERGHVSALSTRIGSFAFAADVALDLDVTGWRRVGRSLAVIRLAQPAAVPANCPGGGVFLETFVPRLGAYAEFVTGRNQTLTHFGIPADALTQFVGALRGRGVDRLVPVGQALAFDRYWDGYDLLASLTRAVRIQVAPAP